MFEQQDDSTERLIQGSIEWNFARAGLVTGTGCSVLEAINPYQKPLDWCRANVRALAKAPSETVITDAMRHGTRTEPVAKRWYEQETQVRVRETGLVRHPDHSFLAASPDGLVGFEGGIEIKCPFYAKEPYSVFDTNKEFYLWQCQFVMECCQLEWIDFICFLDRQPRPVATIERVKRVDGWLTQCVDGKLFPVPRKGRHRRLDLYQAWANHVHDEFQDLNRCKVHLDPLSDEVRTVIDDDDLNRLDTLRDRVEDIEAEVEPQLTLLSSLKSEADDLKKVIAAKYSASVTNGSTLVQVVTKTPPIDYRSAFEFLGGEQAMVDAGGNLEDFRRKTNTKQISIKRMENTSG